MNAPARSAMPAVQRSIVAPCRGLRLPAAAAWWLVVLLRLLPTETCSAGSGRLIEVRDDERTYVGRLLALDGGHCSLLDRYGRLHQLAVPKLKSFQVVAEQFRAASAAEMREQLRREFPAFEVHGTAHYLVCSPRGRGDFYRTLFEDMYRQVERFYRVRGFRTAEPETALVAIVFGSRQEFMDYCRRDDVPASDTLRGYYSLRSNRVALYDDPTLLTQSSSAAPADSNDSEQRPRQLLATLSGDTADTIVHETTHQVGYNIGIHSRLANTPTWVLEGLATVLESPGVRGGQTHAPLASRLNAERLRWFRDQYGDRRRLGDLARMVAADDMFQQQPLDAYSNAWAVTFFMSENAARTQQFAAYLQAVERRDTSRGYSSADRLQDFQAAFGDIARLEVEFLRFMDRLE